MPELPEVETVARTLRPHVTGLRIVDAAFSSARVMRESPAVTAARLRGQTIVRVRRHGKFLLFDLNSGDVLSVHLGMTGKLLWNAPAGPYTRAIFRLDGGEMVYDDVRQFGRIELSPTRVGRLGPDALTIPLEEFESRIRSRRGRIKPLLLNQAFLGGIGNIYADESLFRARIHPRALAERLSRERIRRLHTAILETLRAAVQAGGSSISDYVDSDGRNGWFQLQHNVYGKEGEPCTVCGTPIRRIVLGQRGTHYCPKCQRP